MDPRGDRRQLGETRISLGGCHSASGGSAAAGRRLVVRRPRLLLTLAVAALAVAPLARECAAAASGKHACRYSDRLCEWRPRSAFGAAVIGDQAFFHGGLLPGGGLAPGGELEGIDLLRLSPYVVRLHDDGSSDGSSSGGSNGGGGSSDGSSDGGGAAAALNTTRCHHQLAVWRDRLLLVGGQLGPLAAQAVASVVGLDARSLQWGLTRQFVQPRGDASLLVEASALSGDTLLLAFRRSGGGGGGGGASGVSRRFAALNLATREIANGESYLLASADSRPELLGMPLVATAPLASTGRFPHLAVTAQRRLADDSSSSIAWLEVTAKGRAGVEGPLPFAAEAALQPLPGGPPGGGCTTVALALVPLLGSLRLVAWSVGNITLAGQGQVETSLVTVHEVAAGGDRAPPGGPRAVSARLSHVLVALPPGADDLSGLEAVELPLHGRVRASAADVLAVPHVGSVAAPDGGLDAGAAGAGGSISIQAWPDRGLVIRGLASPDPACQPGAGLRPFVVVADLAAARPAARAASSAAWCSTRSAQQAAAGAAAAALAAGSESRLHRVDGRGGPSLLLLSSLPPGTAPARAGGPAVADGAGLLAGAFIDVRGSKAEAFEVDAPPGYRFPRGAASCVSQLNGAPIYLEHGGWSYGGGAADDAAGDGAAAAAGATAAAARAHGGFFLAALRPGEPRLGMEAVAAAAGAGAMPRAALAAMACAPGGVVYVFGGLEVADVRREEYDDDESLEGEGAEADVAVWRATGALHAVELGGSAALPTASAPVPLALHAGAQPGPRAGAAAVFLPPAAAAGVGLPDGAVLLHGGTDLPAASARELAAAPAEALAAASWDPLLWLYDRGSDAWFSLRADAAPGDEPPPLAHHAVAVDGKQVLFFGGLAYDGDLGAMRESSHLHILDFTEGMPRWRRAPVDNLRGAAAAGGAAGGWGGSGVAPLPEAGAVALLHRGGVSLAAAPQTLDVPSSALVHGVGLALANLTAGDWLRVLVHQGTVVLQHPLAVDSAVVLSGIPRPPKGKEQTHSTVPGLECAHNTSALRIRSPGAVVENFSVTGCNRTAVVVGDAAAAAAPATAPPVVLRNVVVAENGGAAVEVLRGASATLDRCRVTANAGGAGGAVRAAPGSSLILLNTTVNLNNGSAVVFSGRRLVLRGSVFVSNRADGGAPHEAGVTASGGAVRLVCAAGGDDDEERAAALGVGCGAHADVFNCSFWMNSAPGAGGALFLGPGTSARVAEAHFRGNMARDGGAVAAADGACLAEVVAAKFSQNFASRGGGAVATRSPSCAAVAFRATFINNEAGGDGGAVHLAGLAGRRVVISGAFEDNRALGRVAAGEGGAVHVSAWSGLLRLHGSTFLRNTAVGAGGAVSVLGVDVDVVLSETRLEGNCAGGGCANVSRALRELGGGGGDGGDDDSVAEATADGGAVSVRGQGVRLELSAVNATGNLALGKGGALSAEGLEASSGGVGGGVGVRVSGCEFGHNAALLAGGAVATGPGCGVAIDLSTLHSNRVALLPRPGRPHLAAGGAVFSLGGGNISIDRSALERNAAARGGGAALLEPEGHVVVRGSTFTGNAAPGCAIALGSFPSQDVAAAASQCLQRPAPPRWATAVGAAGRRLRRRGRRELHEPSLLDGGQFLGGGGLYLSPLGDCEVEGVAFDGNVAANGGAVLALTHLSPDSRLRLSGSRLLRTNQAPRGAGGGLLVSDLSGLEVRDCDAAALADPAEAAACLQGSGAEGAPLASAAAVAGAAGGGQAGLLATAAHRLAFVERGGSGELLPAEPPVLAVGQPANVTLVLLDALGQRLTGEAPGADWTVQARVLRAGESAAPVDGAAVLGGEAAAADGVVSFMGLEVVAPRGLAGGGEHLLSFEAPGGLARPAVASVAAPQPGTCSAGDRACAAAAEPAAS